MLQKNNTTIMKNKKLWKIIAVTYSLFLLCFVILKLQNGFLAREHILHDRSAGYWNINLIPFQSIKEMIENKNLTNILGNTLPFLLLGVFILLATKNFKIIKATIKCTCLILFFEILQFVTCLGFFDIDDILVNVISCFLGILLAYSFIHIIFQTKN